MKKSIFLFFAAILCATSAWAWSYKSNANGWTASTSGFTTVTMNSGKSMSVVMLKDVGDGVNICQNDNGSGHTLYCKWTKTSGDIFRGTARWNNGLYSDETVVIPGGKVYIKVGSGTQIQMTADANYTYTADVTFSGTGESYTISGGTVNGATIEAQNSMPAAGLPASLTMSNSYTSKKSGNVHIVFDLKTNKVTETADSEPEPEPEPTVTLYFVNHPEWTNLKAHVWDNNDTPYKDWNNSESMTNTGEDKDGYAVYSYTFPSKYTNIIFKGDGQQTQDNVAAYNVATPYFCDDEWYASLAEIPALGAVVTYDYYVIGTVNGWALKDANFGMTDDNADGVYEKVVTLADGKNQMKINNGTWDKQAGYDQLDAKYEGVSRGTSGDDNNIIINIVTGKDITVKFDKNANEITLDGLTKIEDYYTVVGVAELFGTAWDRANETNKMAKQGDGSYKLVKENVTLAAIGYDWKIAKNGEWWDDAATGVNPSEGNNTLTIATAGRYNVTFTLAADLTSATVETELLEAAVVIPDCFISGNATLTGGEGWQGNEFTMVYDEETETWAYTLAGLQPEKEYELKVVCGGTWYSFANLATPVPTGITEGNDHSIAFKMAAAGDVVVTYNVEAGITLSGNFAEPVTYDYYIVGSFNGDNPADEDHGMTLDGTVYKATVTLAAGDNTLKVTKGSWDPTWGYTELGAAYKEVSDAGEYNNIKITLAEEKEITVIFDATAGKITFEGLTEEVVTPAEDVTVYFINSGNWAEVACYYWGGTDALTWPGVEMTANGEVFEAKGWNVYAITFPGDNTSCIFNDNKAAGATQTGNLEVHDGQYYCYENGIWYERLADVDPLDTRVYLKGQMNEWCNNGYCDMFRKEDMSETVAYRTTWLDANTTYEFKIESAGAWLSYAQAVTKDNCTDLTFEEGGDNCTITTEYAGEYLFIWDMTTNKLSVVYPDPKANPSVLDLMVTDMEFDGDKTFSGSNNMYSYSIAFNLVLGEEIGEGVFALDASSTVDFGGTPFTEVTGEIAPDMSMGMPTAATAVVYGFFEGMYFQLNVQMSAGGSAATPVVIWDGVATLNDATGELTISANWDGDDVYVVFSGFDYTNYECPEVWFYIGGTTWETASIAAYGPATITVEDGGVLVEGTVISGITGTQYELMVFGSLPVEETPDYTRAVTENQWGTICLPNASSSFTGATFYEVSSLDPAKGLWLDQLAAGAQLEAGKPYIFQATATEITVTYTDAAAVDAPQAGENGLTGTFTDIAAGGVLVGNYIIAENKVWVAGASATLPANRAYIANTVPTTEQPQLPGRRRVCMGENAATGLDQIVAPEGQAVKAIENGQLIIIRDGVKYNVQGQKL